jgi:hypothetical protein
LDGKEIHDLAGFLIFRQEPPEGCPQCPAPFRERASISVEDREKFIKTKRFRFVDQEMKPQAVYRYRVISRLTDGSLSDPSNEAEITWRPQ